MDASPKRYATPPVTGERLMQAVREMEQFFLSKLREVYGDDVIDGLIRPDGGLDEAKLSQLDNADQEANGIDVMLRAMGIDTAGLHKVLTTIVRSALMMAAAHPDREIHEHLMDSALAIFQLGWVAHEKCDEWAAEDTTSDVRW